MTPVNLTGERGEGNCGTEYQKYSCDVMTRGRTSSVIMDDRSKSVGWRSSSTRSTEKNRVDNFLLRNLADRQCHLPHKEHLQSFHWVEPAAARANRVRQPRHLAPERTGNIPSG
jgi:hypothetical protein